MNGEEKEMHGIKVQEIGKVKEEVRCQWKK